MAQEFVARVNLALYDPNGTTITTASLRKAYKGAGGYGIVGDAGDGDPESVAIPASSLSMTRGVVSSFNADYYNWYVDIDVSYTYTLFIDTAATTTLVCEMFFSMDKLPAIGVNSKHVAGDGSDHSAVASNTSHRALVTTNPHSVDTSAANGVDLANVDNTSDATKNAAAVTLTNKTLTTPVIEKIYQDAGKTKLLTLPADTDTLAVNDDMLSDDQFLAKLVDGSANSNEALSYISNLISDSAVVGRIMAEQKRTSYISGTVTPVAAVIPDYVGQEYLDTATNIWYKSVDLLAANWEALN